MSKICSVCGNLIDDSATFCNNCGSQFAPPPPQYQQPNYQQQNYQQGQYQQPGYQQAPYQQGQYQQPGYQQGPYQQGPQSQTSWMVDEDEVIKFSLKNGYLTNLISSEGLINEDVVITDKRLYYNQSSWRNLKKDRTEMKIDLDDITATTIIDSNPIIFLVFSGLALIAAIIFIAQSLAALKWISFVFFFSAVVWAASWYMNKKSYFRIEYAGGTSALMLAKNSGSLNFSVKQYTMDQVREFQKAIHKEKDRIKAEKYKLGENKE